MNLKISLLASAIFISASSAYVQESVPKIYGQFKPSEKSTGYVPTFSSQDLDGALDNVRHLFVLVHGAGYKGDSMFQRVAGHLKTQRGADGNLLIVAPQFYSTEGKKGAPYAPNIVVWRNDWWRYGSRASQYMDSSGRFQDAGIATFDVLDSLVKKLLVTAINLETVTFFGFSAGGQLVQRYALYGSSNDTPANHVQFHYIVSSPASYMYLDGKRPKQPFDQKGEIEFAVPTTSPGYDNFGYGMSNIDGKNSDAGTICRYFTSAGLTRSEVKSRYEARDVHYFVGADDTTHSGWDSSDAAMTQGDSRVFRAVAFYKHLGNHYGKKSIHRLDIVKGVGHNLLGIVDSEAFTTLINSIFGKSNGG